MQIRISAPTITRHLSCKKLGYCLQVQYYKYVVDGMKKVFISLSKTTLFRTVWGPGRGDY